MKLRWDARPTIFSGRVDIFYPLRKAISLIGRSTSSYWASRGRSIVESRTGVPVGLLAVIDHGNPRGQLQIDQEVYTAIDLVPQRNRLGRDDRLKHRNIPQSQSAAAPACNKLLVPIARRNTAFAGCLWRNRRFH